MHTIPLTTLRRFFDSISLDIDSIHNMDMLQQSLTHKSYAADFNADIPDNERLEFVGDAVLGSVIASLLFLQHPDKSEADMTLFKIALVREEMLSKVAKDIGIDAIVLISNGEEKSQGRQKDSILSDTLEAFIGYLCIDLGYTTAYTFIEKFVYSNIDSISLDNARSYKTQLQEYIQKTYKKIPTYQDSINKKSATGNVLEYSAIVSINNTILATGYGASKKKAQEDAAKKAIQTLMSGQESANK